MAGWGFNLAAQTGPASRPALLDALASLWIKQGRQPTPAEIEAGVGFTSDQYLREWQTWEGVRTALADHLYQKGLAAMIQGDATKAGEFYRQCLVVSPDHSEARAGLSRTLSANVDDAANNPAAFTMDQAGVPASDAYDAFVTAYRAGRREEALIHYQRANREKMAYVAAEKQRLTAVYEQAVTLFEQKKYKKALQKFEELQAIKPTQAGYEEVYKPKTDEIKDYQQRISTLMDEERLKAVANLGQSTRFLIWLDGAYYLLPSDLGFRTTSAFGTGGAHPKVTSGAFLGGDVGFGVNVTRNFTVGLMTSLAMNAPIAKMIVPGADFEFKFSSGSVWMVSPYAQYGRHVGSSIRVYGQSGLTYLKIKFSQATVPSTFFSYVIPPYAQNTIGGFFGIGTELYTQVIGKTAWGLKFDARYHIVPTSAQPPNNQKLKLSGLRLSAGLVLTR